jgi:uncharacterized cupin superfamily protein
MISRHYSVVGCLSVLFCGAVAVAAVAEDAKPVIGASAYNWTDFVAKTTDVGEYRKVFDGPTATIDRLEVHITTLNPGQSSHPPHKHGNEELVIIKEGTVETLVDGVWKRVDVGGVIFNASNVVHAIRNVGTGPATYHVISMTTDKTPKS